MIAAGSSRVWSEDTLSAERTAEERRGAAAELNYENEDRDEDRDRDQNRRE